MKKDYGERFVNKNWFIEKKNLWGWFKTEKLLMTISNGTLINGVWAKIGCVEIAPTWFASSTTNCKWPTRNSLALIDVDVDESISEHQCNNLAIDSALVVVMIGNRRKRSNN